MTAQKKLIAFFIVLALSVAGYVAFELLEVARTGRVLEFKVTETSSGAHGSFLRVEVAPDAGSFDDFVATAVAIASVIPGDAVTVSVERTDVAPTVDRWRRTLARAQFRGKSDRAWSVITVEPLLSTKEIAASVEYSERAGLALAGDSEPLSPKADIELAEAIAAKHGVSADRVTKFSVPYTETGSRDDWTALPGPGSQHVSDLAHCYSDAARSGKDWKGCK